MKLWGRFLSILVVALLAGGIAPASAATSVLGGKVVDDLNKPIANTSVTLSRAGATIATVKTNTTGAYAFNVDAGAYSIKFVPPTLANSTLNAYDIVAPQAKSLTVQLTKPMPGRAFLTGNVTTSPAMALAADSTVYFGDCCATQVDANGNYRLTPTAGTSGQFRVKAASTGNFSFGLYADQNISINQDSIANFVVPVVNQRIRVVTAAGLPVVGALVEGGQGTNGTDYAPIGTLEGLGSYKAGWKNKATTDSNGYITIQTVKMTPNASAGYLVTAPGSYKYLPQQFIKLTGAGDIVLTLTNPVSQMSGTVRDARGVGIGPVDIGYADNWTTSSANGVYSKAIAEGLQGSYSITYRSGLFTAGTTGTYVSITPAIGATRVSSTGGRAQDFVLKLDTTKVKVVDSTGAPVAKAHVEINMSDGYAATGRYTLVPGQTPSIATGSSNAPTDATGMALVKTLHLDAVQTGVVIVTPVTGSPLSWKYERVNIGAGDAITIVLSRPTVTVSGKVSLSDGTRVAPYNISFSDGRGGDQGTTVVDPATGAYSMQVPVGMKGSFWLTCPYDYPVDQIPALCMSFVGGSRTITANTVVDIVIPTEKTPIHIVDPNGKGLANVSVLINHSMGLGACSNSTVKIFSDYATSANTVVSRVTTDANGWAMATTLKMNAPCDAYLLITPDPVSRYQTRSLYLTIGDGASNTIVLTIPSPVITGATTGISPANGARMITVTGDNFLGATSITWNGVEMPNFKVDNISQIRFLLPSTAAPTGTIVVTNGGGSASYTIN
jgi:protocatechuate 3,4-dioxygenase beta subunit